MGADPQEGQVRPGDLLDLASAAAQKIPDCIHVSSTSLRYKADLDAVRDCQDKARQKLIGDAQGRGKPLSYQKIERIDELQRAQVRDYLEKSGTIIDGTTKSGLEQRLHDAAGDGKDGITPAMGRDILDSLTKQQGFVSPDMRALIEAVVQDGGKLTPETMKKLQGAGRAAKGAGLDLNIDQNTEKDLLEHDFDKDKAPKPAAHADPGNL